MRKVDRRQKAGQDETAHGLQHMKFVNSFAVEPGSESRLRAAAMSVRRGPVNFSGFTPGGSRALAEDLDWNPTASTAQQPKKYLAAADFQSCTFPMGAASTSYPAPHETGQSKSEVFFVIPTSVDVRLTYSRPTVMQQHGS
jgi:hypothetical protein